MWYNILDNLSNSDRTKWPFFLEMGAIEFLNCIEFYRHKEREMKRLMIIEEAKRRASR